MIRLLLLLLCFNSGLCLCQIGGSSTFEFLNLPTSPRAISLGGYSPYILDDDINNAVDNSSLINKDMLHNLSLNYTNYFSDIFYGDVSYCFSALDYNFVSSIKFIDYGTFIETNEYGQQIGTFTASEYIIGLGSKKIINSLIHLGVNSKLMYSSLYDKNAFAFLLGFSGSYIHPNNRLVVSILFKNMGYQIDSYYEGYRESLPFEILLGVSNKLEHMPLRWHFTFQHIEKPDLGFSYNDNSIYTANNNLFNSIIKHFVFGAEFLMHKNLTLLIGYNNRRRSEMIIEDRKGLVGFSGGVYFQIKRFKFHFSRTSNHFSGPINSFGIITNFKK